MEYQFFKAHHGLWMKRHFQSLFLGILGGIFVLLHLAVFSSGCSN